MDITPANKAAADKILVSLGMFTVCWSSLRTMMEMSVWLCLRLGDGRGKIVTSPMTTAALIEMLQTALSENELPELNSRELSVKDLIKKLKYLNSQRNEFMHSSWHLEMGNDLDKIKSSRVLARGKLHTREKTWANEDIESLCRDVMETSLALHKLMQGLLVIVENEKKSKSEND
jgi:hypothetical protein